MRHAAPGVEGGRSCRLGRCLLRHQTFNTPTLKMWPIVLIVTYQGPVPELRDVSAPHDNGVAFPRPSITEAKYLENLYGSLDRHPWHSDSPTQMMGNNTLYPSSTTSEKSRTSNNLEQRVSKGTITANKHQRGLGSR